MTRQYKTYQDYVRHQASKLGARMDVIQKHDKEYEKIIYSRYDQVKGKKILCLAARLGGEVRAFNRLGAEAIGIDLNPGKNNKDVIRGDFHNIPFGDNFFDIVFCNSVDHVLYLSKFLKEARRVTKSMFILEFAPEKMGRHAARSTTDEKSIMDEIKKYFTIQEVRITENNTHQLSGKVHIYILIK